MEVTPHESNKHALPSASNRRPQADCCWPCWFCSPRRAIWLVAVNFANPAVDALRHEDPHPKLIVMLITAFAIGGASIVFQSIINNTIVTPCLLGMNSLYTLIHTAVVFFCGSASVLACNANLSFAVDVVLMGITATVIYSYLFQKDKAQCTVCAADRHSARPPSSAASRPR
ncbi:MAG: iron chelate uptake ABC transporter family permease subunit [Flavonifractor plautii]